MPNLAWRVWNVFLGFLRMIDIVVCFVWLAPLHILGLADCPTGRQLISSYTGKAAYYGKPWALRLSAVIDFVAVLLGDGPEHCRRAYEFYLPVDLDNWVRNP